TRSDRDWSSDVCSSDLGRALQGKIAGCGIAGEGVIVVGPDLPIPDIHCGVRMRGITIEQARGKAAQVRVVLQDRARRGVSRELENGAVAVDILVVEPLTGP